MTVVNFLDGGGKNSGRSGGKRLSPESEINQVFQFLMKSMMLDRGMRESLVFHEHSFVKFFEIASFEFRLIRSRKRKRYMISIVGYRNFG